MTTNDEIGVSNDADYDDNDYNDYDDDDDAGDGSGDGMLRIHPLTRSHIHSFIHSLIRPLTTHSYIPSFMHSVMSAADHQCEDSALGGINIR